MTEDRTPEIDPPLATTQPNATPVEDEGAVPSLPDLADVRHGATLIDVTSEWDQTTWSAVNLIDGRADRGWSANGPDGAFVIGIAHPTIQAMGIDTRQAEEQDYPGISAVRVEVERATDLSAFPDLDWEPVGVLELDPQTLGVLDTPDLFAPVLRFQVTNGGDPKFVEIMEVRVWGELTDGTAALDTIELAEVLTAERPNASLLGADWAFHAELDGRVLACSSDGTVAQLESADGALVGVATAPDGSEVEMLVSALADAVTAIADQNGSPRVGWGALDPSGPLTCDDAADEASELVPEIAPPDRPAGWLALTGT